MKAWIKTLATPVLGALLLTLSLQPVRAGEEEDLLARLKASSATEEKAQVCDRLKIIGTTQSVPALGELLADESLSMRARTALETMPGPEAGAALRAGVAKAHGTNRAGIVDALGNRHDPEAVSTLKPLLDDVDTTLAASAAVALGKIGGDEAVAALKAVRPKAVPALRPAVDDALLHQAAALLQGGDRSAAQTIYKELLTAEPSFTVQVAARRGLILSADDPEALALAIENLKSGDDARELATIQVIPGLKAPEATQQLASLITECPAATQIRLMAALATRGDGAATPALVAVLGQDDAAMRLFAIRALSRLGDPAAIMPLAAAAAKLKGAPQTAAREALASFTGAPARAALEAGLTNAPTPARLELIRALGEQGAGWAAPKFMTLATNDSDAAIREGALGALAQVPSDDNAAGLLAIATAAAGPERERTAAGKALGALCAHSAHKEVCAPLVLTAYDQAADPAIKANLLPVMAALGTPEALAATQAAVTNADSTVADAGVRALAAWPNPAAASDLLRLAQEGKTETHRVLALRGYITQAQAEPQAKKRLAMFKEALARAARPEERRQILGSLGGVATPESFTLAAASLNDPEVGGEAAVAAVTVAEALQNDTERSHILKNILIQTQDDALKGRIQEILKRQGIIQTWAVAGPYTKDGLVGAQAYFDLAFAPEIAGQEVQWKPVNAPVTGVDLTTIFGGLINSVAYLRARIDAPAATPAVLLLGSDDGIKLWLNGEVVHANNSAGRPLTPGEDHAAVTLRQGRNDLLFKITQNSMGWGVSAQILAPDGQPIEGLSIVAP